MPDEIPRHLAKCNPGGEISINSVTDTIDITIVMPCLNEAETLGACIEKARLGIQRSGMRGEILVADNGSEDSSVEIDAEIRRTCCSREAKRLWERLRGGIQAASGKWILMGTPTKLRFSETDKFVKKLQEGFDLSWVPLPSAAAKSCPVRCLRTAGYKPSFRAWRTYAPCQQMSCGARNTDLNNEQKKKDSDAWAVDRTVIIP